MTSWRIQGRWGALRFLDYDSGYSGYSGRQDNTEFNTYMGTMSSSTTTTLLKGPE